MADMKYVRMKTHTAYEGRRLPEGTIVALPDDGTAERWIINQLASSSSESAYRNQQQVAADLAEEQAAQPPETQAPDAMITREDATGRDAQASGPPSTRAK